MEPLEHRMCQQSNTDTPYNNFQFHGNVSRRNRSPFPERRGYHPMDKEGDHRAAVGALRPRRSHHRARHPHREAELEHQHQRKQRQQLRQVQARVREHDAHHGVRVRTAARPGLGISPLGPKTLRNTRGRRLWESE